MEALFQVCDPNLIKNINISSKTSQREYIKLLKEMAVPFDDMFIDCVWSYDETKCSEIFTEVITEEGICYTFNMLDEKDIFRSKVIDSENEYSGKKSAS